MSARDWIPLERGAPDDEELVLVAVDNGDVGTGFPDGQVWRWADGMPIQSGQVTHWMRTPAPPGTVPTLRLGQICERIGFDVTAAFLARLGFFPIAQDRAARLYAAADYPLICAALARHVLAMQFGDSRWLSL